MQTEAGQLLRQIQVELAQQAENYARPFWELGVHPATTRALLARLWQARRQLWSLDSHFTPARDPAAVGVYAETLDAFQREIDFLEALADEARGSVDNTRRARGNAAASLRALNRLIELEAGNSKPDPRPSSPHAAELPNAGAPTENLHRLLREHFSKGELRDLCLDLDIPYEELEEGSISSMSRTLVEYSRRHSSYERLVARVTELRPGLLS